MLKLYSCFTTLLRKFDLFPTTQFLRYKSEAEYKTATGGFVSMAVIVIFVILFYSLGTQTVNRQIINGSVTYNIEVQPSPLTIKIEKGKQFMFAVGIIGLNLSDPSVRYFNLSLSQNYFSPLFQLINSTQIPLVQCTPDHFTQNQNIINLYKQFNVSAYLCPSLNSQFTLGGKITSLIYSQLSIKIQYCNRTIDPTCLSYSTLELIESVLGGFTLSLPLINTIVNPGDEDYKQLYLQDRNYYYFTVRSGVELIAQVQQYQIDTDTSLMPYTSIQNQFVTAIPELFLTRPKEIFTNQYVKVIFRRSSTSTVFTRSFNKIDNYFSYVGGLVGTILLFFFVLSSYSQNSYVVSIASDIYRLSDEESDFADEFNFASFFALTMKRAFEFLKIRCAWKFSDKVDTVIEEMEKQLSVAYLLKRVNFLQEAVTSILPQHQILALYLNGKASITEASKVRKKVSLSKDLLDNPSKVRKIKGSFQETNNVSSINLRSQNIFINQDRISKLGEKSQAQQSQASSNHQQCMSAKIKQSLNQVINQSIQGNQISRRIIEKVSKKIYTQKNLGQGENFNHKQISIKNEWKEEQKKNNLSEDYFQIQNK